MLNLVSFDNTNVKPNLVYQLNIFNMSVIKLIKNKILLGFESGFV